MFLYINQRGEKKECGHKTIWKRFSSNSNGQSSAPISHQQAGSTTYGSEKLCDNIKKPFDESDPAEHSHGQRDTWIEVRATI